MSTTKSSTDILEWDYDQNDSKARSAKIGWTVAALATLTTIVMSFALAALAPLKTIEPVFVRIDDATGIVDVLQHLDDVHHVSKQDAQDMANLAKYVRNREGYYVQLFTNTRKVVLQSSDGRAKQSFLALTSTDNPDSPVNRYGDKTRTTVRIKSINFLQAGIANVRFILDVDHLGDVKPHPFSATVTYDYVKDGLTLPLSILLENPLGFVVTDYNVSPEVL